MVKKFFVSFFYILQTLRSLIAPKCVDNNNSWLTNMSVNTVGRRVVASVLPIAIAVVVLLSILKKWQEGKFFVGFIFVD